MANEQIINEKYWKYDGNNRIGKIIAEPTGRALKKFCEMEPEFEQAIRQSDKSFSDCINNISSAIKGDTSDFAVYEKAVKYYFPQATISYHMSINMSGEVEAEDEAAKKKPYKKPEIINAPPAPEKKNNFGFDINDLLDF